MELTAFPYSYIKLWFKEGWQGSASSLAGEARANPGRCVSSPPNYAEEEGSPTQSPPSFNSTAGSSESTVNNTLGTLLPAWAKCGTRGQEAKYLFNSDNGKMNLP